MPLFQYTAIGTDGKKIKATLDADSLAVCKDRLRRQKILVTSIEPLSIQKKRPALSKEQLLAFTRELAQLLRAGLPLYDSLLTIEEKRRKAKNHSLFASLCDDLRSGHTLSNALAKYPETFTEIYISMIRSAELSGSLFEAFRELTTLLTKQQKLKKQLVSALAYPAFLGSFCLLVIIGLFFFVIPSMQDLFEDRLLHPLTSGVIFLSQFLRLHVIGISFFVFALVAVVIGCFKTYSGREYLEKAVLKTPYISKIAVMSSLIPLFRVLSMLLEGGVPLVSAIKYARDSLKMKSIKNLLDHVEQGVVEGKTMSLLLSESSYMPPLVGRMVAIGEETGSMALMIGNIAEIYEEELDKDLLQLTTFLQPALLLFLGIVVGIVVLSVLLPLTDVSSFIST